MNSVPSWFVSIQAPLDSAIELKNFFLKHENDKYLHDLISLFGRLRISKLQSFLPEKLNNRCSLLLSLQDERFEKIWKHFRVSLKNQIPLDLSLLQELDLCQGSTFKGNNPRDLLVKDLLSYLLLRPMPLQECKLLGCYSITPLRVALDCYKHDLEQLIVRLFEDPACFLTFTIQERCLLIRTTALISYKRHFSWAELLYDWGNCNNDVALVSFLDTQLGLDTSFVYGVREFPQPQRALSFREFVIQSTLYFIFDSRKAPLPRLNGLYKNLSFVFSVSESDTERQNTIYYIDTIFLWFQQKGNKFPFTDAYELLQTLQGIGSENRIIDHALHSILHYFQALSVFDIQDDKQGSCKQFLFEAIYAVPIERQQGFDKEIKGEKFQHPKVILDENFLNFALKHALSPEQWGEIFLRFARTRQDNLSTKPSPYLSLTDHLQLVEKMEKILGLPVPINSLEDLLFFQAASIEVFEVLDHFENFQQTMTTKQYIENLNIPNEKYSEWESLSSDFIGKFITPTLTFEGDINGYRERNDCFPLILFGLARILQISVYPEFLVSFEKLIPRTVWWKDDSDFHAIVLHPKGEAAIDRLHLFEPDFPTGPLWMASWKIKKSDLFFCISVVNSIDKLRTANFSLKVPSIAFLDLVLFRKLVDGLGKENLSDEEALSVPSQPKSISYPSVSSHHEKFDWYLQNSPLVKESYIKSKILPELKKAENKAELYEFVRSLRSLFKKAFYSVLFYNRSPQRLLDSDLSTLIPFENGFYLRNVHLNHCISEIDVLRISDYREQLEKIYYEWNDRLDENFFKEDVFKIKIGTEKIQKTFVSLQITDKKSTDEVSVTWILAIGDQDFEQMICYAKFKNKEVFILLMIWQLALLKQKFLQN